MRASKRIWCCVGKMMLVAVMVTLVTLLVRLLYTAAEDYTGLDNPTPRPSDKINYNESRPSSHSPEENEMFSNQENVLVPQSDGIYVSIKTTLKYHSTRLPAIILTWLQNIKLPSQVHIVTDGVSVNKNDKILEMALKKGFRITYANCSIGHQRESLCCKSGVEYDQYYAEILKYRWYCHFDDDIYVNLPKLVSTLSEHDPIQDRIYIGRWPLATEKVHPITKKLFLEAFPIHSKEVYRYATGAAYCISASLMTEVEEYFRGTQFALNCEKLKVPDDMLVGCIIEAVLGYNLINERSFNSNLNSMRFSPATMKEQVTLTYGTFTRIINGKKSIYDNKLTIPEALYSEKEDPTRFFSYHCFLYPNIKQCRRLQL